MLTSRSLNRMKVTHSIVVEPQDEVKYLAAVDKFELGEYATIVVLPFSNLGLGSYPARNWCWEDSIANGHERHWILDDNIMDFYRLHKNERIRVESSVYFTIMEDLVDRYNNVSIAGPQYRFFVQSNNKRAPLTLNTRVFSCLLIQNSIDERWRLKYNEDIDLCINVLKGGNCIILFNALLQAKSETQSVKGGNTEELYGSGTVDKSQMLIDAHPDVVTGVMRYGRAHHHADLSRFSKNKFILKDGVDLSSMPKVNNYGLRRIDNFKESK